MVKLEFELVNKQVECENKSIVCKGIVYNINYDYNSYELCEFHLRELVDEAIWNLKMSLA